jgi:hypothetical protein
MIVHDHVESAFTIAGIRKKAGLPIEGVPHDEVALLPVFR